jgi:hypothetical protein
MYSIFVGGIIVGVLGLMLAFLVWVNNAGLESFIIAWSLVFIVFFLIFMALFYVGGKERIK